MGKGEEMSKKYIVEINEDGIVGCDPYAQSEDYKRGMKDAWAAARALFSDMSDSEVSHMFPEQWNNGGFKALMEMSPEYAINRLKENHIITELMSGDEIEWKDGTKAVVLVVGTDGSFYELNENGFVDHQYVPDDEMPGYRKTGRNLTEIASVIRRMVEK